MPEKWNSLEFFFLHRLLAIYGITLLMAGLPTIYGSVTVEQSAANGLIFKPTSSVFFFNKMWNVMTYISKEKIRYEQYYINDHITQLEHLKLKLNNDKHIQMVLDEILKLGEVINETDGIILNHTPKREKRAILPFVGSLIEYLFGNPDMDTMKEIIREIEENKQNNIQKDKIIHSNTIFIGRLIETIENKNKNVDKEISAIIKNMNEILAKFNNTISEIETTNGINVLIQSLTLAIIRYKDYQHKLLNHILSGEPIHIDPDLIPLTFLEPILQEIESKLDKDQMLPFAISKREKVIEWYKTIPMRTMVVDENIVFEFIIPVVSRKEKEMLEVIPAPIPKNDHLLYIEPESQYIITDKIRSVIGFMSQQDVDRCWKIDNENIICSPNLPIFNRLPHDNYCELTVLLQSNESHNCVFKTLPKQDMFIKIRDTDQYYFVVSNEMFLNTICGKDKGEITLQGTGLLTVNESCSVFNQKLSIDSQSTTNLYKKIKYVTNQFIPIDSKNKVSNKMVITSDELTGLSDNFEQIKEQLKYKGIANALEMQSEIKKYYQNNSIYTGVNIFTTILCIAVIATYLYFVWTGKHFRRRFGQSEGISMNTYYSEEAVDKMVQTDRIPIIKKTKKEVKFPEIVV
jgi:hypothetical protein